MAKRKKRSDAEGVDYVVRDSKKRTGIYERNLTPAPKLKPLGQREAIDRLIAAPSDRQEWFDSLREYLRGVLREYGVKIGEHGLPDCDKLDPTDATIPEDVRDAFQALEYLHGLDTTNAAISRSFNAGRAVERLQIRGRVEEIVRGKAIITPTKATAKKKEIADERYQEIVREYWKERPERNHNSTIECLRKREVAPDSTIDRALRKYLIKAGTDFKRWQSKNTWFTP